MNRRLFYSWAVLAAGFATALCSYGCVKRPPARVVRFGYELKPSASPPPDYRAPTAEEMEQISRNTWPVRCPVCGQEYSAEDFARLPEDKAYWFDDAAVYTVRHCNHELVGEPNVMRSCGTALVRIAAVRDSSLQ